MDKDRTWMNHRGINDRRKHDYIARVNKFLEYAFHGKEEGTKLRCPCVNCNLCFFHNRTTIHNHLIIRGIVRNYSPWIHHGECEDETNNSDNDVEEDSLDVMDNFVIGDDMRRLVQDAVNVPPGISESFGDHADSEGGYAYTEVPTTFDKLMEDAKAELYHGYKTFTRLEFVVTLLHIKVSSKWSEKSFSMLLKALQRAFNNDEKFPASSYEAKKYTKVLGLDYVKIDACINHCVLYWKENKNLDKCSKCHASRWKEKINPQ